MQEKGSDLPHRSLASDMGLWHDRAMQAPMRLLNLPEPFDHEEFLFELKWDGYRALAIVEHGKRIAYLRRMIRTTIFLALTLIILPPIAGAVQTAIVQSPTIDSDDRQILDLVFEQIRRQAGLHVRRSESEPIFVVDHARPVCRKKVTEYEMYWPWACAADPLRPLKNANIAALPDWLRSTGLSEASRTALIQSFEERNQAWRPIAPARATGAQMLPRGTSSRAADGTIVVVFGLPGYSPTGHAVVHATFSCGSLCGTEYVVVLHRSGSQWKIVSEVVGLWIA